MPSAVTQLICQVFLLLATALFLIAWLLPNHYYPWLAAYQDFLSFAAALLIMSALLLRPLKSSPSLIVFALLALIPILQLIGGLILFSGDALIAAIYLAGFTLMLQAGYNLTLKQSERNAIAQLLAAVLILGAVLSVWVALRQWLLLSGSLWIADLKPGGRPFANLAQPNNLASLLCMGLAGVLFFYEKWQLGRFAASLLALVLIFGVALTQSRTPWVGAIAIAVFWCWKSPVHQHRLSLRTLLIWLGVYGICVLALPHIASTLLLSDIDLAKRAQAMQRWDLWQQFWHALYHGPLWGYGWNQISMAQIMVSLAHPLPMLSEHSHNILLDLLLWNGPILGSFIILGISIWLLRLGWHARTTESLFALIAAGFLLMHAMLEYPLAYAFFLLPFGLLLGLAAAEQRSTREFTLPRWLLASLLLVAVGLFSSIWHEYRIIDEEHRLMRFEAARIGAHKNDQTTPDLILLTQLREFIRFARTPATENMSTDEIEWMRKVTYRYPYPSSLYRYALALALNNQPDAAREQLLILHALHGDKYYEEARRTLESIHNQLPSLIDVLAESP